jgi:hypothetical protein
MGYFLMEDDDDNDDDDDYDIQFDGWKLQLYGFEL